MKVYQVSVISDSHGLLRDSVRNGLQGSDLIVHAGDIGTSQVLHELRRISPVIAVRGNCDREAWAAEIPQREVVEIGDRYLYVLHNLQELDLDPVAAGFSAVIYGHTHKPTMYKREGVLYLNPGSVGPQRFSLPVSMAKLSIMDGLLEGELLTLSK